jgi:hypothetical protein
MERVPQPKATLVVKVMEHGTITGTDGPVRLEFEDCVGAVDGLVTWLADTLAEVNEAAASEIGTAILVDALHHWIFDEGLDDEDVGEGSPEETN